MQISRRKPNLADIGVEKKILTSMITNSEFLDDMSHTFKNNLFKQGYMNQIGSWCIDFYKDFGKAPNRHIEDIFQKADLPDDQSDLIKKFLHSLSDEYERAKLDSAEYMYKDAVEYFEKFKTLNTLNKAEKALIRGDTEEAQEIIRNYEPVEVIKVDDFDIYDPRIGVFSEEVKRHNFLFKLPGELGKFIGNINRGELIAAVAPSGVGKTWWLQFLAEVATLHGVNVLFVSMEMSKHQMLNRFRSSIMKRPVDLVGNKYLFPQFDCYKNQIGACDNFKKINQIKLYKDGKLPDFDKVPSAYNVCSMCKGKDDFDPSIWYKEIYKKNITDDDYEVFHRKAKPAMCRRGKIHFVEYPMSTLTMKEFKVYISIIRKKLNFVPGFIITDYADKFELINSNQYRHQIGEIWGGHKSLAQSLHVGVGTASQSNTSRNPYKNIQRGDWEEAILKLNLVDGAFSINQNPEEKLQKKYRIRSMKKRSSGYSLVHECHVLSALELGRPCVDSVIAAIPKEELKKRKKEDEDYAEKNNK